MPSPMRSMAASLTTAAVLALALTGCSAGGTAETKAQDGKVIAPGKPGEAARTLSPDEARAEAPDDSPNTADVRYVRMMIEHHKQALVMTDLAEQHADSDSVTRLASRIAAAQGPEIDAMDGWLKTDGRPRDKGGHQHHHESMPGMASEDQLADLREARGPGFDRLFLSLMTTHHRGAVTMAEEVLAKGNNVRVEEMANDVMAQQTIEIERMRKLKGGLQP